MKCKVCNRIVGGTDLCIYHIKALENVRKNYEVWNKALGISWTDYLDEIRKNSLTGEWAKEVAKYLIKDEEKPGVKEI
jgi:hypothetical protein